MATTGDHGCKPVTVLLRHRVIPQAEGAGRTRTNMLALSVGQVKCLRGP